MEVKSNGFDNDDFMLINAQSIYELYWLRSQELLRHH